MFILVILLILQWLISCYMEYDINSMKTNHLRLCTVQMDIIHLEYSVKKMPSFWSRLTPMFQLGYIIYEDGVTRI